MKNMKIVLITLCIIFYTGHGIALAQFTGSPISGSGTDWTVDQGSKNIHAGNIPDISATYQPTDTALTSLSSKVWGASATVGGAAGALDAIPVASLADGDTAIVSTAAGVLYLYVYESSSATAESDPLIVKPDDNSGNGRWLCKLWVDANGAIQFSSINLPSTDASPSTTAGQIRHDTVVTGLLTGAIAWWDGDEVRYVVDLDVLPVDDDYVVAYDADNDKFYMKASSSSATVGIESIDAGGMVPDTCSGLLQNDSNPNIFDYLAFDGATDEYALFRWVPPDDWDLGTIKAKFMWAAGAAMTNAHTVIWGIRCYAVSDGDSSDVAFAAGEQTVSDAYATADETGPILKITGATAAITVQGTPAAGDVVYCQVYRDADTDTGVVDAWLKSVKIQHGLTGSGPSAW